MEVARGGNGGKLNPCAEPFVPGSWYGRAAVAEAEQEVEDFSPEWWRLISSSPSFRDRWLHDYDMLDGEDNDAFLPDDDELFSPPQLDREREDTKEEVAGSGKKSGGEVAPWGIEKWWRAHVAQPEIPRYAEKAPRKVAGGARVSPRPIQQPR